MGHDNLIACLTCDVELGSDRNEVAEARRLAEIIGLFDKHRVAGTFFVSAGELPESVLGSLASVTGHELGLHIHWGYTAPSKRATRDGTRKNVSLSHQQGLNSVSNEVIRGELSRGLESAQRLGFTPRSFRGGGLCQNTEVLRMVKEAGFAVDSSVARKLNEKNGWFQGHAKVPFASWYWPAIDGYDRIAGESKERMGILEVPVTRSVYAGSSWFPHTLVPGLFSFPKIVNEWVAAATDVPIVATALFHSWGDGIHSLNSFNLFLRKLGHNIGWLKTRGFSFMTMSETLDVVKRHGRN